LETYPYSEVNAWSTKQKIPSFYENRQFIIAFATANHRTSSGTNKSTAEPLGSGWTDFYEILCSVVFRNSVKKIQVLLKSDKHNGHFT
jgi:hypothetical protein